MVTSYNVANRIIYEWGTCAGAIRRLTLEVDNIEITQDLLIVKYVGFKRHGICIRDYRYTQNRKVGKPNNFKSFGSK